MNVEAHIQVISAGTCREEIKNQTGDGVEADSVPDKLSCLQEGQVYNHVSNQRGSLTVISDHMAKMQA